MDTYPTKREVWKIIDSKCHFGGYVSFLEDKSSSTVQPTKSFQFSAYELCFCSSILKLSQQQAWLKNHGFM